MTDASTSPEAKRYLAALDAALTTLPASTRLEIVAGVHEELLGLDSDQASERIAELGDPEFIAATALAEFSDDRSGDSSPAGTTPGIASRATSNTPLKPPSEPRWFSTTAGLLLLIGGVALPVVAPLIGLGMMWNSRSWTRPEKWTATLAPVAVGAVILLASLVAGWLATPGPTMTGGLSGLAGWHISILAVFLTPIAVGGWLLLRDSRRRSASEPMPSSEPARTA